MPRTIRRTALAAAAVLALACGGGGGKNGGTDTSCDPGWHACGSGPNDCAPDSSPLTCGTRCTPCPADPSGLGAATCAAGACGLDCGPGYHVCAGACFDDGSAAACGPECLACPPPAQAHASAACVSGQCGYACDLGFLDCAAGCCPAPQPPFGRLACGGAHTCAVDWGGAARCWGANAAGQVGDGTRDNRLAPVQVLGAGPGTAAQASAGAAHSCGVSVDGAAWCWGDAWSGQLGDGVHFGLGSFSAEPVEVTLGGGEALMTAAGWGHACALLRGGEVRCWGNNEDGQLGWGEVQASGSPLPVALSGAAYAVLAGRTFGCAVTGVASMECWGGNARGQLGDPDAGAQERLPVPVAVLAGVDALRAVALGGEHACAAYDAPGVAGGVRCWGRGDFGQLGHGATPASAPGGVEVEVAEGVPLLDVVALAAGGRHTCAVTGAGALKCWGDNDAGQLGSGPADFDRHSRATAVHSLGSGVGAVAAGDWHTCALVDVGAAERLFCWGQNDRGQLGDGTTQWRRAPVEVTGF